MLKGLAGKRHLLVVELSQLAQLGTVRQVLGCAPADLQRAGAVQIGRTYIEIRDLEQLRTLATDR